MYMRADGPNSVTDATQLEDIWDFYIGKCPLDILNALRSEEKFNAILGHRQQQTMLSKTGFHKRNSYKMRKWDITFMLKL